MEHKYIKGSFSRSFYEGENGYLIGIMKLKETNVEMLEDYVGRTLTFTGYFDSLNQSDTYIFYGEEKEHPRFGLQFNVTSYEKIKPTDKLGIITFLSSDLFPGIGEKVATNIVEVLGENALDLILEDETVLNSVPKLNDKKKFTIVSNLIKYDESHKIIVTLSDLGFSMKEALSIYNFYQDYTMDKIYENVYELIDTLELPFTKVDQIAINLDYSKNDPNRVKACIIYIMNNIVYQNGDTYLNIDDIYTNVTNYLKFDIDNNDFKTYLNDLVNDNKIVIDNNKYYLSNIWEDEEYIIDRLYQLSKISKNSKNLDNYIELLSEEINITYNDTQKEAIKDAINDNLLIITGGPGTGKTTIIKAIVALYQRVNKLSDRDLLKEIALLAPTGRASKRMAESCKMPSSTIHHFLRWNKETNAFAVNEYNKDDHKLIIVDEVSMIDIPLFASLLRGTRKDIKLILVGDYNQLPSVGPGELLKDLIDSNKIETIHLDKLYRQDENSYIVTLADEIKNNKLSNYLETKSDYTFLECPNFMIGESLKNIINKLLEKDLINKSQVMAPMYKGENGIDNLNKILQSIINPSDNNKKELKSGNIIYREGDKILQLINMPDEGVYNGDIGYIVRIEQVKGKDILYVSFDGNIVEYTPANFNKITHGYVISIHKSQGSEFDTVIIPMTHNYNKMLYRKLIYTAVTRAKRKLIILGEPNAFLNSVENKVEDKRKTDLVNKLTNMYNNE